ncbi:MAG: hypothetical protein SOI23_03340 [Atopobiaceae bacterium]
MSTDGRNPYHEGHDMRLSSDIRAQQHDRHRKRACHARLDRVAHRLSQRLAIDQELSYEQYYEEKRYKPAKDMECLCIALQKVAKGRKAQGDAGAGDGRTPKEL